MTDSNLLARTGHISMHSCTQHSREWVMMCCIRPSCTQDNFITDQLPYYKATATKCILILLCYKTVFNIVQLEFNDLFCF